MTIELNMEFNTEDLNKINALNEKMLKNLDAEELALITKCIATKTIIETEVNNEEFKKNRT